MSDRMPLMRYSSNIVRKEQNKFRGLNHNMAAGDGEIYDMENMCSDMYPAITTRPPRYTVYTKSALRCLGMYGVNQDLYVVYKDLTTVYLYKNNTLISDSLMTNVSDKHFATINDYLVIFPDKVYYKFSDSTTGNLEHTVTTTGNTVFATDGTITFDSSVDLSGFANGDGLTISGCTVTESNNKTIIVRTVKNDEHMLEFYDNSFESGTETTAITFKRAVPDLDFICVNENRLWGCSSSENKMFASKQGDPKNFNVFDGLITDSYFAPTDTAGDFTGAIAYRGFVAFFKEDAILKVFGTLPENFQVSKSANLGVKSSCYRSLSVAGEVLYYLSKAGVVSYSGGIPQIISERLGNRIFSNAVGGSDGVRYYVSLTDNNAQTAVYVYDTRYGTWHKEENENVVQFAYAGKLYYVETVIGDTVMSKIYSVSESVTGATKEANICSSLTFTDFTGDTTGKKGTSNILLRIESEPATGTGNNAIVTVTLTYDSNSSTSVTKTYTNTTTDKRTIYYKMIPRRCDHYSIKIESTTAFTLYSFAREFYSGTER